VYYQLSAQAFSTPFRSAVAKNGFVRVSVAGSTTGGGHHVFRAEVIGSMLRPSYLKEARAAFEQGSLSARDFKRLEDRAVDQVIALQEGTGVDVVSDGEMRRFLFMGPITETVEGIELVEHDQPMPWNLPRASSSGSRRRR
jgi:hypothetical protein